ncbi:MAG: alpha/beta hydrolase [Flavobacteriales bacterium]|nr:alpha/beta hydrolase [Flavobacteriales bacterium]
MANELLHYSTFGSGDPILLLSGGPGFAAGYLQALAERLSGAYQVILPDQRGTGASTSADTTALTLTSYLSDLERLRVHLEIDRWTLVGHSWGGMLASAYAERYTDRVRSLVLINIAGLSAQVFDTLLPHLLAKLDEAENQKANELLGSLATAVDPNAVLLELFLLLQPTYFADNTHAVEFTRWLGPGTMSVTTYNSLVADLKNIGFDLRQRMGHVKVPVLLLSGTEDPFGEAPITEARSVFPQASLALIPASAHYPMLENLDATAHELLGFLRDPMRRAGQSAFDVTGAWNVTAHQEVNGKILEITGSFTFNKEGDRITGSGTLDFKRFKGDITFVTSILTAPQNYAFDGSMKDEFVSFAYRNVVNDAGQYGHMMLRVDPDGKRMEGKFQGFGPEHRKVINGAVVCERPA